MGASNVFGELAKGYTQAAQLDQQRAFQDEQNRRSQLMGLFEKLANDPTAHPNTRIAAAQLFIEGGQVPHGKQWKPDFNRLITPAQPAQPIASSGTPAPPTPPPGAPPGVAAAMSGLGSGGNATLVSPPTPPGLFMSPEQLGQHEATVRAAIAGSQMQSGQYVRDPATGELRFQPISGTGAPIGPGVANAVSPYTLRPHLQKITGVDTQTGQPFGANYNTLTGQYEDDNGQVLPNFVPFQSSLVPRTTTEAMDQSGAVTRRTTRTPQAPAAPPSQARGGATALALQPPPPPPGMPEPIGTVPGSQPQPSPVVQGAPQGGKKAGKAAPSPTAPQAKTTHVATFDPNDANPIAQEGIRWATQGQKPAGGVMSERQVLSWMKQHGLTPALPVPPSLQQKIQESFVARNSAIDLINDVMKNSDVLDSLMSAGKIQIAITPSKGAEIMSRLEGLNPRELRIASDFQQLIEHANLLRGPLGATGFRSEEAWQALQAQRGNLLAHPDITRNVLTGMRERLLGLNNADKMVLSGHGMETSAAGGSGASGEVTATGPNGHKIALRGGQWVDATTGQPLAQ